MTRALIFRARSQVVASRRPRRCGDAMSVDDNRWQDVECSTKSKKKHIGFGHKALSALRSWASLPAVFFPRAAIHYCQRVMNRVDDKTRDQKVRILELQLAVIRAQIEEMRRPARLSPRAISCQSDASTTIVSRTWDRPPPPVCPPIPVGTQQRVPVAEPKIENSAVTSTRSGLLFSATDLQAVQLRRVPQIAKPRAKEITGKTRDISTIDSNSHMKRCFSVTTSALGGFHVNSEELQKVQLRKVDRSMEMRMTVKESPFSALKVALNRRFKMLTSPHPNKEGSRCVWDD